MVVCIVLVSSLNKYSFVHILVKQAYLPSKPDDVRGSNCFSFMLVEVLDSVVPAIQCPSYRLDASVAS